MLSSLSEGTLKQYNTTYKAWWAYCKDNELDVFTISVTDVLKFLTEKYNNNAGYSTLNTDRSALSLLMSTKIGNDENISRFLKGVYRLRPPLARYTETWKPSIVLNFLSSWPDNNELSLEKLTKKLAILIALASGQRVQTLSKINLTNVHITNSKVIINITDIIKTSVTTKVQPSIHLPFFTDTKVCPCNALQTYIEKTSDIRNNETYLWLTIKKPHKRANSQTLSRWMKEIMQESGIDITKYSAHSTRHSATSTASKAGVHIDVIRKAAGWSDKSTVFAKHYNLPLINESSSQETFAQACMNRSEI